MNKITLQTLRDMKGRQRFAALTAYDSTHARLLADAGIEVALIGDSLGNVVQGHSSTAPVRMEDMIYHTACVAAGGGHSLLMADMPFMSCANPQQALENAAELMRAGAHSVKLEGGAWLCETVAMMAERGIAVCGHLGLMPQSVHRDGGYRTWGKSPDEGERLLADARALCDAGAELMLLECVTPQLAARITAELPVPVIGIGSGGGVDGQVLVLYDMLGASERMPRFARNFMEQGGGMADAIRRYRDAVRSGEFPGDSGKRAKGAGAG